MANRPSIWHSIEVYGILNLFRVMRFLPLAIWLITTPSGVAHQLPALHPIRRFPLRAGPIAITRPVEAGKPFTVAGERGGIFGDQNGTFEAWLYPVKVLSGFRIIAELADYAVPIGVTGLAAGIEVTPAMTTITYSHAAFTVKQRMLAPRGDMAAGAIVLFEIDSIRPLRLTFRFKPEMLRMWPASNFGTPNAEWVTQAGGYYVLHTDDPEFSAAVAMPHAQPGILPPYQERPQTYPVELKLSFHPKTDAGLFFPLLMVLGDGKVSPARQLAALNDRVVELCQKTQYYYAHFFDTRLTSETPDPEFDRALRWAAVAIDQGRVRFHDETGLVAGYYTSADSARPGDGWFFGRDALWTAYALNSYGAFELTRQSF